MCNDHIEDDEAFSVVQFDVLVKLANELQPRRSVRSTKVEVCVYCVCVRVCVCFDVRVSCVWRTILKYPEKRNSPEKPPGQLQTASLCSGQQFQRIFLVSKKLLQENFVGQAESNVAIHKT